MFLAVNTSTFEMGLALLREDASIQAECTISTGSKHFAGLLPTLHFLLNASGVKLENIKAIMAALGPGSFTGLRVGLSASKGLCHSLKIPLVGVPSLEAMASQIFCTRLPIVAILDSRRGEVFAAEFVWEDGEKLVRTREDTALDFEDLPSVFDTQIFVAGNNFSRQAPRVRELFGKRAILAPPHQWGLKASAIGFLGAKRFSAHDYGDPSELKPIYLRPPEIRPNPFPPVG